MATTTLHRSVDVDQYEWLVDGQVVAVMGYEERGSTVLLLHTATDPAARGQGHATRLVEAVLADLAARRLVPSVRCPFVRAFLQRTRPPAPPGPGIRA